MQRVNGKYVYSPSDLIAFVENEGVSWLDRFDIECPRRLVCDEPAEDEQIIREAGDEHEAAFWAELQSGGYDVVNLRGTSSVSPLRIGNRSTVPCLRRYGRRA